MAKTSFSFCPLLLCSSSPRDIKFQHEEKRNSCIFGLANFFRPSATSRGSIPSSVLLIVPPVCFTLHLHTAAARNTANHPQHPRYTTRNTTRYTTRNTAEMLPGAAFRVRTEKSSCIFISFLKSIKASKCCPCQQFGSVACSVACSVAWGCHATLVTFMSFFEKDSASSLLLVRQPFSGMPALLCPACVAI